MTWYEMNLAVLLDAMRTCHCAFLPENATLRELRDVYGRRCMRRRLGFRRIVGGRLRRRRAS